MTFEEWLPKDDVDFFGLKLSKDWKDGWADGRSSLNGWYMKLTLWERFKLAYRGYLISDWDRQ